MSPGSSSIPAGVMTLTSGSQTTVQVLKPDSVQEETGQRPQTHSVNCGMSCAGTAVGLDGPCVSLPTQDVL